MRAVPNTVMKFWLSQNAMNTVSLLFIGILRKLYPLRAEQLNVPVVICVNGRSVL